MANNDQNSIVGKKCMGDLEIFITFSDHFFDIPDIFLTGDFISS